MKDKLARAGITAVLFASRAWIVIVVMLVACGLTQKQVETGADISARILCAIEHAELDDAALDGVCGVLTYADRLALAAHRRALVQAKTIIVRTSCDGGVQ